MRLQDLPHLHGVLVLPATIFDAQGEIDWQQTRREIEFTIECGATGVCFPCGIGEFRALTEEERKRLLELAVDTVNGRLPVVACGSGLSTKIAIMYHKHARENGCVCCMTMPPAMRPPAGPQQVFEHYAALAEAVDIPIMLHNLPAPVSWPMSADLCVRLFNEIELVNYIKEEAGDSLRTIPAIRKARPKYLKSLLSSDGGVHEVDDAMRGADGTIVGPEIVDCHVQTWEAIEQGDIDRAWQLHRQYLPLNYFVELQRNIIACKEVLKRRGVITSTTCRTAGLDLFSAEDHRTLDALLKLVSPMFRIPLPTV